MEKLRLGINIDHIATLRNARGGLHPDPVRAALAAQEAGADGITIHLREDRRHIRDADVRAIKDAIRIPLNLEMAATPEMLAIALNTKPHAVCLVPEKREELTTEGGLDITVHGAELREYIAELQKEGIKVSLFVDPDPAIIAGTVELDPDALELHTGSFCAAGEAARAHELQRLREAAESITALGMECHAGHGLCYESVAPVAAIPQITELNIGHFLMGEAQFVGLGEAIARMRRLMDEARGQRVA